MRCRNGPCIFGGSGAPVLSKVNPPCSRSAAGNGSFLGLDLDHVDRKPSSHNQRLPTYHHSQDSSTTLTSTRKIENNSEYVEYLMYCCHGGFSQRRANLGELDSRKVKSWAGRQRGSLDLGAPEHASNEQVTDTRLPLTAGPPNLNLTEYLPPFHLVTPTHTPHTTHQRWPISRSVSRSSAPRRGSVERAPRAGR